MRRAACSVQRAACGGADVSSCVGHRRIVPVDEMPVAADDAAETGGRDSTHASAARVSPFSSPILLDIARCGQRGRRSRNSPAISDRIRMELVLD
ncbi:hypothetical protein C7S16_0285 [Burkholderia thailandensis]|uniref:Uncharacterized protein n=1 Tax=Burkholderia thailandensis TaxID=57975 RepID=A0AAW9D2U6_BURTH|nr:hypothetical protein [Burkholderia thailandensis]